ncbi:MAG: hypothetical protein FJX76_13460 [Armatimonadetes bacterium]|nr:hypothetical protein [Armatimonadota bacterium]
MNRSDGVIVLGAGIAGLGCARALPGAPVFEATDHLGGHAFSHEMGGVYFDEGAHICHSRRGDFLAMILSSAGRVIETDRSVVRNYWRGRWLTYPVQDNLNELPLEDRLLALTGLVEASPARAPRSRRGTLSSSRPSSRRGIRGRSSR